MGPLNPLGVATLLLLWISLVSAGTELQVIFKTSPAYAGLNDHQRRCSVSDVHSASRASRCDDRECFCASPQTMSDDTDDCMITLEGTYNVKGIYSADTYNGVMTFFANECGTFEVQLKVLSPKAAARRGTMTDGEQEMATQSVTYKTNPTQTNFGSGAKATGGAGETFIFASLMDDVCVC
jgi:hypothetical protein